MAGGVRQTAVVVPVPGAEGLVADARLRHDTAALGVPAHVTIVYPFLPWPAINVAVLDTLATIVAAEAGPSVTFARVRRFPGVLWLEPSPGEPFVRLTRELVRHWPEAPPYRGAYGPDVTPHLTVTSRADDAEQAAVEARLLPLLPVTTTVTEAVLLGFDGSRWTVRHRFPFAGPEPSR